MKQITFIHAADLHLDSPMVGLKHLPDHILKRIRESTFLAFQKLTKAAIEKEVDFIILAGDLFDGEDRSLKAQSKLRKEMTKLNEKNIPIYVIHGNHDHLGGSWVHLDMPTNVHTFSSEVEIKTIQTKSGETVQLYGFSYPKRHVYEKKINDYYKMGDADFHIGILHGNVSGQSEHGNYAPFYIKDLLEKQFDYWALGHIHKRSVLYQNPPIIYPGNIQGRNKKETGTKGCYYVSLSEFKANMEFIETSDIVWEEAEIDAAGAQNFQDIFHLCQSTLNHYRKNYAGTLLTLYINNVHLEDSRDLRFLEGELQELLQDEERDEESFVWIVDLKMEESISINKEHLMAEGEFYSELFKTIKQYDHVERTLASLYEHPIGRKYLSSISSSDKQQLLQKTENLLIRLLYPS